MRLREPSGLTALTVLAALGVGSTARAEDDPEPAERVAPGVTSRLSGHLKSFATASLPYDHLLFRLQTTEVDGVPIPSDPGTDPLPSGQGVFDARLNLEVDVGEHVRVEVAHAITGFLGQPVSLGVTQSGVGLTAPELVELTWFTDPQAGFRLQGRTDRLLVQLAWPGIDVALGRQPISFGAGQAFTPLDLVNPFNPAVIDSEYKPGVDALRVDLYPSWSTRITLVGAWVDDPLLVWPRIDDDADVPEIPEVDLASFTTVAYGQATVGVSDLGLLVGLVHGDFVAGATVLTSVGPVGLHGDVALTLPELYQDEDEREELFVRAVVGALWRPTETTTLTGELYLQTLGSTDPKELFTTLQGDRFARGELWLAGVGYASVSVAQEIVPTVNGAVSVIGHLTDPSALLVGSLSWNAAQNHDVALGLFYGLGERPDDLDTGDLAPTPLDLAAFLDDGAGVNSEFGTYPASLFLQWKTYF